MKQIFVFLLVTVSIVACSPNNVIKDESLKKYFDDNKVKGCFGMYDNGQDAITVYDLARFRDSSYLPASTFKIVNSLIALETGRVTDTSMIIKWDGVNRDIENWNQDLSMQQAFKYSSVPYYQEVARRIGKDTMQRWLNALQYGTRTIKGAVDSFWLNNTMKVTSDEQLGLVKRLYFTKLDTFQPRTQRLVKDLMLQEDNANYKLSYKTGMGYNERGHLIGWMIGWIEENNHPYFFVTNVESTDPKADMVSIRMNITRGILKKMGFFEGKK
jgi:beta-lactamase class D